MVDLGAGEPEVRPLDPCGVRAEGDRFSVWYGCVLVTYARTHAEAVSRLLRALHDALEDANKGVLKADDRRNYIIAEIERIAREGPDLPST